MSLADGTRLEHYEIVEPLGAGGMGEVYRAVDTKLRREVAIKILPARFASDPSRLARFEREAHLLASLNHPNIAAIYGLEHIDGIRFLVLELVEGPTLSERVKSGPMEVGEALGIAAQIAEALEAAHEKGVVHRDLKPGNVKITPAGKVKVLDFGLAKALGDAEPATVSSNPDAQSTATLQETKAGVVMGTAAYMSPEQAEGKPTDKRSDVWSFGVVLYEMLSGKRCFDGKTTSHVMLHVLEQEPDWQALPVSVPPGVRALLERCLTKDPAERLRYIGDLRLQLQAMQKEIAAASKTGRAVPPARAERSGWLWPAVAGALALAALVLAFLYFRPKPAPAVEVSRFDIAAPEKVALSNNFAVSPDGRQLAFIAKGEDGVSRLWIRSLETGQARALDGTNDANGSPIWSPDSRSVAFSVGRATYTLMKVEASGSPPQVISYISAPSPATGGSWTSDNKIVFAQPYQGVREVSAAGGAPTLLIAPRGPIQVFLTLLPDGHHFLYMASSSTTDGGIYLGSLDAKPEQQGSKKLLPDASPVAYAPSAGAGSGGVDKGYLLFLRGAPLLGAGTLMAQSFDARKLELAGDPIPIAEQVANFSVSPAGVLVYRTVGSATLQLVNNPPTWFDRQGKILGPAAEPGFYTSIALSPDEKRLATGRLVPPSVGTDIWLYEFANGLSTRFTFDKGLTGYPVWSPDGGRIAFESDRAGKWDLYVKASNGVGEDQVLLKTEENKTPTSWSRDGRFFLYNKRDGAGDLWVLPMGNGTVAKNQKPFLFAPKARGGEFSPDMRWIAYVSPESGGNEAWVRPFDPTSADGSAASGGKWMVSRGGATSVRWRGDGKELFYAVPDGMIMSVDVTTSPSSPAFGAGVPKPLFKGDPLLGSYWDVSSDGRRFLFDSISSQSARDTKDGKAPPASAPYKVVLNWQAGLKK